MSKTDYYSETTHGPHEIFELGKYQFESGITLPNARIAYKTHGTLNAAKEPLRLDDATASPTTPQGQHQ